MTEVHRDGLVAQVKIHTARHRMVSLVTREAADELGLEPGVAAAAVVKATMVTVETLADGS